MPCFSNDILYALLQPPPCFFLFFFRGFKVDFLFGFLWGRCYSFPCFVLLLSVSNIRVYVSDLDLNDTLQTLLVNALKPNTHPTYSNAQNRFLNYCSIYGFESCPASESTLLYYIAYLFKDNLKGSSI
jgi:hypothetical protein